MMYNALKDSCKKKRDRERKTCVFRPSTERMKSVSLGWSVCGKHFITGQLTLLSRWQAAPLDQRESKMDLGDDEIAVFQVKLDGLNITALEWR